MITQELSILFAGINATLDTVKKTNELYEPVIAYNFNPLNFFYPGENKTSEILAFFLDLNETHAQKDVFLKAFVNILGLKFSLSNYHSIKVKTEQITHNGRRIDICISFDGHKFGIGIENKIWAVDQYMQLQDYEEYLRTTYDNYLLVYLTPWGKHPSEGSISKELFQKLEGSQKIKILAYDNDIFNLLHEWGSVSQSERVRYFLKDFQQFLQQEINEETFMNEHALINKYILETGNTAKNVELALSIADASEHLKTELLQLLNMQLKDVAESLSLDFQFTTQLNQAYSGFRFYHPVLNKYNLAIVFEFEYSQLRHLYYGLARPDNTRPINEQFISQFQSLIFNAVGTTKHNENWAYWKYFNEIRVWGKTEFIQIANGELKETIRQKLVEILQMLTGINAL
ncbi:MAG: PD-(D/E)XK nuclease family protein [Candidatus Kuenenia stuttgartiensis]|nr:PD-(D/E)XK nuclease family protein [Candidatus Kuenenia stuttgartiensis]